MKSPKLVIAGDSHSTTAFVTHEAIKAGYAVLKNVPVASHERYMSDPNVLVMYVSSRSDPFRDQANVVLRCTEEFGSRQLQISHFMAAVSRGKISTTESDQYWSHGRTSTPRCA